MRGFRVGVTAHGRKYLSAGLPGTGIVYRHYQRKQKPLPVYASPEVTHPATHPHSLGYFAGYICGLLFWIGIPLFVIGWIVSLVWKAIH